MYRRKINPDQFWAAVIGLVCMALALLLVAADLAWPAMLSGYSGAGGSGGGGGTASNSFTTMNAPSGTDPTAASSTDTLNFAAGGILSISGNSSTNTLTFSATEVDGSITNEVQNLFETFIVPNGTNPVADTSIDSLTLSGTAPVTITGTASTDTIAFSLADVTPDCSAGQFVSAVGANLALTCGQPGNVTGNANTATALATTPTACLSNRYATSIAANGDLTCSQVSLASGVTGTLPLANITDDPTASLCLISGGTAGDPTWGACSSGSSGLTGITADTGGNATGPTVTISGTSPLSTSRSTNTVSIALGTVGVAKGGTGLTTFAQGSIPYASALDTIAGLAKDTNATRYLSNTGTSNNPAWAQVDLSNGVTSTLPLARITDDATASKCLLSGGSGGDPNWGTCSSGGVALNSQVFTSGGTWTKPAGTTYVHVKCVGSGGGGGSGAKAASGSATGGAGGAGGFVAIAQFEVDDLPSTVSVTIGAAPSGGAAKTTSGPGNAGTAGNASYFGSGCTGSASVSGCYLYAAGGAAGAGGNNSASNTATTTNSTSITNWIGNTGGFGGTGGGNNADAISGVCSGNLSLGSGGGGGGGGAVTLSGSSGGRGADGCQSGGAATSNAGASVAGSTGNSYTTGGRVGGGGGGGGGGAANTAGNSGGTGGAGGTCGGGGGGGGGAIQGGAADGGAGGAGGGGCCWVTSF